MNKQWVSVYALCNFFIVTSFYQSILVYADTLDGLNKTWKHHEDSKVQNSTIVHRFEFNIQTRYAPLAASIPSHTAIYNEWPQPQLRKTLPHYISIATMISQVQNISDSSYTLMGAPIHVVEQNLLDITLINVLQNTGLSLHFHGFEMNNAVEYDGVVGLTQCAVPPSGIFRYKFKVNEKPGLYWYHTHSGNLGVESHNVIKAPLIVHPDNIESRKLVEKLNAITKSIQSGAKLDHSKLLSYKNERILFFSDGFTKSDNMIEMYSIGGLNSPVPINDDGFVTAAMEHEFGTVNGKMREVVHVMMGQTYKFRLVNGGTHFAYRISISNLALTIVASDSHPVIPYTVDEVILHNGERFDVEVSIPTNLKAGDVFWIRADTLEGRKYGYQNGIRAILHIVEDMDSVLTFSNDDIMDPRENIAQGSIPVEERKTMNCYSNLEKEEGAKNGFGSCLPIHSLQSLDTDMPQSDKNDKNHDTHQPVTVRTVDFDMNNAPLHAYFSRIEYGNWYQHVSSSTHVFRSNFDRDHDFHPHASVMNVPSHSSVIIIWRSRSIMDQ